MTGIGTRAARRAGALTSAAGVCAASALAISGCGATNAIDPVAQAAVVSTNYTGYQMNFNMQFSSPALPGATTMTGHGSFDVPARSGSIVFDMNLGNIPQLRQVLGSSTLRLQELTDGLTFYVKLPASLTRRIPGFSKPWVKIDLATAAGAAGIPGLGSLASNPASADPSQFLRYLRAESGGVTTGGNETVDGLHTIHYRATIHLDRVATAFPAASRAQVRQTVIQLERLTKLRALPVNVWVDGRHLVRRMQLSFDESLPTGQSLSAMIRMDIPQYGPQPAPVLPPAGEVTDATHLAAAAG